VQCLDVRHWWRVKSSVQVIGRASVPFVKDGGIELFDMDCTFACLAIPAAKAEYESKDLLHAKLPDMYNF
jgi:hypothetical protein